MENTTLPERDPESRVGPRSALQRDRTQSLSESRAALLERLRDRPEPTTLAALTSATGLHVNTVREHLDALVRYGLVRRHRAAPHGRGRPAWLYETTDAASAAGTSEYAGLATTLAAAIHRSSDSPRADAVAAGTEWGHELARDRGAHPNVGSVDAQRRVLDLLDDLGFAPEGDAERSVVRLTRCPLLEAAHRYTEVVCGVHLGIIRGALAEYGAASTETELLSFAEPGACLLRLLRPPEPTER